MLYPEYKQNQGKSHNSDTSVLINILTEWPINLGVSHVMYEKMGRD